MQSWEEQGSEIVTARDLEEWEQGLRDQETLYSEASDTLTLMVMEWLGSGEEEVEDLEVIMKMIWDVLGLATEG
jgi:hypothetical protein